jgi:sarcosine oxidase subunit gamma
VAETLKARTPLDGLRRRFDGIEIAEPPQMGLVSLAPPQGGEAALEAALGEAYGLDLPEVGRSHEVGGVRLLGVQRDQFWLIWPHETPDALAEARARLGEAAYMTDQSDAWAMLRLFGSRAPLALERICMLDLEALPDGAVARTLMEHLGIILLREGREAFLLLSARSSARSFLHAVETSARNVS